MSKKHDIIKSGNYDHRIYYTTYQSKKKSRSCECRRRSMCNFSLEMPIEFDKKKSRKKTRKSRILEESQISNLKKDQATSEQSQPSNDVLIPPMASEHFVRTDQLIEMAQRLQCQTGGTLFFNGRPVKNKHKPLREINGLYECYTEQGQLTRQDYVTVRRMNKQQNHNRSRCGDLVCLNGGVCEIQSGKSICRCDIKFTGVTCATRRFDVDLK